MDADNFIWILFVVGGVIFGFIQNITKKTKEMSSKQDAQLRDAKAYQQMMRERQQQQHQQQLQRLLQLQAMQARQQAASAPANTMKTAPAPAKPAAPKPSMPIEGERVTKTAKTKAAPAPKPEQSENPLRDKGNLVRALIYGDVLKQRF